MEGLKKEAEKLENREKQNEWFMIKQLEDSLTQSNHNLLALNKKKAMEIEKEAMESE